MMTMMIVSDGPTRKNEFSDFCVSTHTLIIAIKLPFSAILSLVTTTKLSSSISLEQALLINNSGLSYPLTLRRKNSISFIGVIFIIMGNTSKLMLWW